jgi:hypothetical protein
MKRFWIPIATGLAIVLITAGALAQGTAKKAEPAKAAKPVLDTYLIESPHTAEECMGVMDEANKAKQLGAWDWGCVAGNHTAYRMVKAADETAALAMVPESVRSKARAMKLMKMTPAQLAAAHKGHM